MLTKTRRRRSIYIYIFVFLLILIRERTSRVDRAQCYILFFVERRRVLINNVMRILCSKCVSGHEQKVKRYNNFIFQLFAARDGRHTAVTHRAKKYPCSQRDGGQKKKYKCFGSWDLDKRIVSSVLYYIGRCDCRVREWRAHREWQ